jgi:membrane-bound serine protease (ClpP class)
MMTCWLALAAPTLTLMTLAVALSATMGAAQDGRADAAPAASAGKSDPAGKGKTRPETSPIVRPAAEPAPSDAPAADAAPADSGVAAPGLDAAVDDAPVVNEPVDDAADDPAPIAEVDSDPVDEAGVEDAPVDDVLEGEAPADAAPGGLLPGVGRAAGAAAGAAGAARPAGEAKDEQRIGRLITIPSPITSNIDARVRRMARKLIEDAKGRGEWPVLIFEIEPGANKYGASYDLADFISSLTGATTVAYIPQDIEGHSLLLAMACDQIAMDPEAEIGAAGADEDIITDAKRGQYAEIANRRRTIPTALALGMLDPQLEVWKVETEVSREYVLSGDLEELRKKKAFVLPERPLIAAGEVGRFTGAQARELGIVNYLATDRGALVKLLGLPRDAAYEDLGIDGAWRAVTVKIKGPITPQLIGAVQSSIQQELANDANFFCIWIDSPGGSPEDSMTLANFLSGPAMQGRRTAAFIPTHALGDAAFIALACDDIVMLPEAMLGGAGAYQVLPDAMGDTVASIRQLARAKFRAWSLPAAMVDARLRVYRQTNRRDGLVEFFSAEEAAEQAQPDDWEQGDEVTTPGRVFQANGNDAERFGLAHHVVNDFHAFKALYGLEDDPRLLEPGWADMVIDALSAPGVAWLLLLIGGAALYAEFHTPGVGVGAFIAGVCFLLFFWSKFLGGTAGWLEIILFLAGLTCVIVELFVLPGFGVFGLGGGLLIITSLVLASQTFTQFPRNDYQLAELRDSVGVVVGAVAGVIVSITLLNRYLPKTPVLRSVVLAPPTPEEQAEISRRESVVSYEHLVGREGVTTTQLTPAGKARFEGHQVDVMAAGEVIPRGARVVVVEARGNWVLVRAVG